MLQAWAPGLSANGTDQATAPLVLCPPAPMPQACMPRPQVANGAETLQQFFFTPARQPLVQQIQMTPLGRQFVWNPPSAIPFCNISR